MDEILQRQRNVVVQVNPEHPDLVTLSAETPGGSYRLTLDATQGYAMQSAGVTRTWNSDSYGQLLWKQYAWQAGPNVEVTKDSADRTLEEEFHVEVTAYESVNGITMPSSAVEHQRLVQRGESRRSEWTVRRVSFLPGLPQPDSLKLHAPDETRAMIVGVTDGVPRVWRAGGIVTADVGDVATTVNAQVAEAAAALPHVAFKPEVSARGVFGWAVGLVSATLLCALAVNFRRQRHGSPHREPS